MKWLSLPHVYSLHDLSYAYTKKPFTAVFFWLSMIPVATLSTLTYGTYRANTVHKDVVKMFFHLNKRLGIKQN